MAFSQATKNGSVSFRRIQIDQILNGNGISTKTTKADQMIGILLSALAKLQQKNCLWPLVKPYNHHKARSPVYLLIFIHKMAGMITFIKRINSFYMP